MGHHLAVDAILAGDEPGDVYVDHPGRPRAAVLVGWNRHRVYLAGAADDDAFNAGVAGVLADRRGGRTPFAMVLYHDGGAWARTAPSVVPGATAARADRRFLRWTRAGGAPAWRAPDG